MAKPSQPDELRISRASCVGVVASLGCLVLAACAPPTEAARQERPDKVVQEGPKRLATFLMAGQSNMAGTGCALELPPELRGPLDQVQIYNRCRDINEWQVMVAGENTNCCGQTPCKDDDDCIPVGLFGPEVDLGVGLAAELQEPVYLIKVGVGGTFLAPPGNCWQEECDNFISPCQTWAPGCGDLYTLLIETIEKAQAGVPAGSTLDVRGIFWAQGTFDSGDLCTSRAYGTHLAGLRDRLRSDIVERGLAVDPVIPFVVAQSPDYMFHWLPSGTIPSSEDCVGCFVDVVRRHQRQVVLDDPRSGLFDGSDLTVLTEPACTLEADYLHFDTAGQRGHGQGLFRAFLGLDVPPARVDLSHVDLSAGGSQELILEEPRFAGLRYVVVGTYAGASPGQSIDGVPVPLNPDAYFTATMESPTPVVAAGNVDASGHARAEVFFPKGSDPVLAGARLHHAFLFFKETESGSKLVGASNPLGLWLLP